MCGIYGSTVQYSKEQFKNKLERISFRGPDFTGIKEYTLTNGILTLGHNRLAIVDLDERSNQPFDYRDLSITFNGEVYNYVKIKETLTKKGHIFETTSDTEVICAAYLEYGEKCVEHFTGMFAFVIFDKRKNVLFGARDRMGKKPFYYYHDGLNFEFASQLSSIAIGRKDFTISDKAVNYYLAWNAIPDPYSIYKEVFKLKPGHKFTFDLNKGEIKIDQYWDVLSFNNNGWIGTYEQAQEQLESILETVVAERMMADVSLGTFLSGGVDSSLITAIAQKQSSNRINTFSVKFSSKGFDESAYAQLVADHLGTNHHVIECNYYDGMDLIENFSHFYDEPFADSSAIPSLLLAKETKKHVTVALTGDGGDESFMGYHRYNWIRKSQAIFYLPKILREIGSRGLQVIPHYRLKVIGKALGLKDINRAYIANLTNVDHEYIQSACDFMDLDEVKWLNKSGKNLLERVSDLDLTSYINWDINTKVDRASMAFAVESRAPLMDHRIIEFAQQLPTEFKFGKDGIQKRILKDVLYKHVPKSIFDRPKAGFAVPIGEWFKTDLKGLVESELNDKQLQEIPGIDPKVVSMMIKQHMDGKWNRTPLIWKLLVLKQWLNNNI